MGVLGGMTVSFDANEVHTPVLRREVVEGLEPALDSGGLAVDATLGAGGHAEALLSELPECRLLGIDQDPEILELARERLAAFGDRAMLVRARLSELPTLLSERSIKSVDAVLFDLGVSSLQLDRPERGFSFAHDGPLDMRMDPDRERTAADIVNAWDEADLADLFYYEGGESRSRAVAAAIVASRRRAPFKRTAALADLIASTLGGRGPRSGKVHPATRCFQALRRAVNEEGDELLAGLDAAEAALADGGRLAVISFHSGEDKSVKHFLAEGARRDRWRVVTKKPLVAESGEARTNPRARSAKLRIGERTRAAARGEGRR